MRQPIGGGGLARPQITQTSYANTEADRLGQALAFQWANARATKESMWTDTLEVLLNQKHKYTSQKNKQSNQKQTIIMKTVISLIITLICAVSAFAQGVPMATVYKYTDNSFKYFYGSSSINEAIKYADCDSALITLSSGNFEYNNTNINISLSYKLRICGTTDPHYPDSLSTITEGSSDLIGDIGIVYVEGVNFEKGCFDFSKSSSKYYRNIFDSFFGADNGQVINLINCRIHDLYPPSNASYYIYNSVISESDYSPYDYKGGEIRANNCIVYKEYNSMSQYDNLMRYYTNCLIITEYENPEFDENTILSNCVVISSGDFTTKNPLCTDNHHATNLDEIFESYSPTCNDLTSTYKLTPAAKAKYTAQYGDTTEEIGLYGGAYPFDKVPNVPKIRKFDMNNKSTVDGKLNINIEIGNN